jgi:RNA polymerase sigma-70 factor (ECF subfamily)
MTNEASRSFREIAAAQLVRHHNVLYGYILACVRNHADAEDVLQDVAVAVMQASASPTNDDDFFRWAREIARRRVLEFQRKAGRSRVLNPQLVSRIIDETRCIEEMPAPSRLRDAFSSCVEELPEQSRLILADRYGSAPTDVEVFAKKLGRTSAGLYQLLYRVRELLRECVDRRLAGELRK